MIQNYRLTLIPVFICFGIFFMACDTPIEDFSPELQAIVDIHRVNDEETEYFKNHGTYVAMSHLNPYLKVIQKNTFTNSTYIFSIDVYPESYQVWATPDPNAHIVGRRTFFSDQTGIIRQNRDGKMATEESQVVR